MRKLLLKSKNTVLKILLTLMGFALATTQCLAQYMAITPDHFKSSKFTIKGLTDTISRFMIVINKKDTAYLHKQSEQEVINMTTSTTYPDTVFVEVSALTSSKQQQPYQPFQKMVAIKPTENKEILREYEIQMRKKED